MKSILILGSSGQLGQVLKEKAINAIDEENIQLLCPTKDELDITKRDSCINFIKKHNPSWTINSAAYTKVDQAESEPEKAYMLNAKSLLFLSETLREYGGKLIHISTDSIFHSEEKKLFKTTDKANPVNIYGKSKLQGETYIKNILFETKQAYIIRTSWLMGQKGSNFLKSIIHLHKTKRKFKVVSDQTGFLTSSSSLADFCWKLINIEKSKKNLPQIIHWCDGGETNWYEIASFIGELGESIGIIKKKSKIEPITLSDYPAPAKRSLYSLLEFSNELNKYNIFQENWQEQLKKEIELYKINELQKKSSL